MNSTRNRLLSAAPWGAGILALTFLLLSTNVLCRNVGFFHDELWDYIPAVAMINSDSLAGNQEVTLLRHTVPLVTGPYQGALKAWISGPLLLVLGTSPHTLRTMNVMFAMLYLAALYWALIPAIGKKWAWVVFCVPFVDINFLITAPLDTGPSLFQYIFISLVLGLLFRYLSSHDLKHYRLIWFFSGCLLAQKLTAIPLVIAFSLITAGLALRIHWNLVRTKPLKAAGSLILIPAVLSLIPMIPHLIYFMMNGLGDLFSMTGDALPIPYFSGLKDGFAFIQNMFDGTDWYQRITLDSIPAMNPPWIFLMGLAGMSASVLLWVITRKEKNSAACVLIAGGAGLCGFLLMPCFRGLNRPWHFYILSPLFWGGCAVATVQVLSFGAGLFRKYKVYAGILLGGGTMAAASWGAVQGTGMLRRIDAHRGVCLMSPAIFDAYQAVAAAHVKSVYAVNLSLAYPIYVLSKGTVRVEEFCWSDLTQARIDELLGKLKTDPNGAILYRYCNCTAGDRSYIQRLNMDPQIADFIKRIGTESPALRRSACNDTRQTEFVLLTNAK